MVNKVKILDVQQPIYVQPIYFEGHKGQCMNNKESRFPHQGFIFQANALRLGITGMLVKTKVLARIWLSTSSFDLLWVTH